MSDDEVYSILGKPFTDEIYARSGGPEITSSAPPYLDEAVVVNPLFQMFFESEDEVLLQIV
jgi:hypothetical protein